MANAIGDKFHVNLKTSLTNFI